MMPHLLVILLNFTVNYLLILATAGLCRIAVQPVKLLFSAAIGAFHVALCLLPVSFLHNTLWHILTILLMGIAAFGKQRIAVGSLLVLFLALESVMSGAGIKATLAGLCAVILLILFLRNRRKTATVPVRLTYAGCELSLTALRDTGNRLCDPVTGAPVMVIGPDAAEKLTGLTPKQLKTPLKTLGFLPGLRLIPYHAVGSTGFLLGLNLPKVQIGSWKGTHMVAFAPEGLSHNEGFEALIGGTI